MRTLNYNHLYYFWTVAREGTIARAAEILHLTPQTISGQLGEFEMRLDARLFTRNGRKLLLTDTGRMVYDYADHIFRLGNELTDVLRRGIQTKSQPLNIGIIDALPSLLAYRLLQPAYEFDNVSVNCRSGKTEQLLADLSINRLDYILSYTPLNSGGNIRAYNHQLGQSGITFFTAADLVADYSSDFPSSLDNAPLLLPTLNTPLRRSIEQWFRNTEITPYVCGEFESTSLIYDVGESGAGVFAAPTVIKQQLLTRYNVGVIADVPSIGESYYLISSERRLKNPAAVALFDNARSNVFAASTSASKEAIVNEEA